MPRIDKKPPGQAQAADLHAVCALVGGGEVVVVGCPETGGWENETGEKHITRVRMPGTCAFSVLSHTMCACKLS